MKGRVGASVGYFQKDPSVTTIYVGNLRYTTTEMDLKKIFERFGKVKYVNLVQDKETNKNTGIAFVQMPNGKHAKESITQLDGTELDGRTLKVSVAQNRIPATEYQPKKISAKKAKENEIEQDEVVPKTKRKRDRGLKLLFDHLGK